MANIIFRPRVKETTVTTGTGNITLAGAPTGFQTFNTAFGTGVYFYYAIEGGGEWEEGEGHLSAATTLVRDTVRFSSNSNAAVNFSAGTKNVFCTLPAYIFSTSLNSGELLIGPASTHTLTNKTISLGSNTVTATLAQLNTAITDADIARTDAANTFTGTQTFSSTISGSISGNAATVTTIPSLSGDVTSSSNSITVTKINGTALSGLATGILKNTTTTGVPSIAVAADFPTLNQNTTGSAATLTTSRNIYGNSFNGSADVTSIIASTYGGTGNGFTKFSGPATAEKTFTLPNASATILTTNALVTGAQGGTNNGFFEVSGPATSTKTFTFPNANATIARTDAAQTFTGTQTFSSTISGSINGNAATVTTNANLTGNVTSSGNVTTIASGVVTNAMLAGSIDLTTKVTGILPSANGGTANGFFTVSGPATSAKTFTFPNASATVLTDNAAVTVAQGGSGTTTLTGILKGNGTSAFTAVTAPSGALVGDTDTQTLSGKTLTAPKFADLGFIADPSGNEYLIFDNIGTAVNEFTISNAPSGNFPTLSATGGDGNVGIIFQIKGDADYRFAGTTSTSAEILLFEGTSNGSNSIGITVPTAISSTRLHTLPDVANDTIALIAATQTFTNKTLTSPAISGMTLSGSNTMSLGSDATGDIYYRNSSGFLTRLAVGTTSQVLQVSSGLPSWQTVSAPTILKSVATADVSLTASWADYSTSGSGHPVLTLVSSKWYHIRGMFIVTNNTYVRLAGTATFNSISGYIFKNGAMDDGDTGPAVNDYNTASTTHASFIDLTTIGSDGDLYQQIGLASYGNIAMIDMVVNVNAGGTLFYRANSGGSSNMIKGTFLTATELA